MIPHHGAFFKYLGCALSFLFRDEIVTLCALLLMGIFVLVDILNARAEL